MPPIVQTALSVIEVIIELLKAGAQYLPLVEKYFDLAWGVISGRTPVTPEIHQQIETAYVDVNSMLEQAAKDREAEAAQEQQPTG